MAIPILEVLEFLDFITSTCYKIALPLNKLLRDRIIATDVVITITPIGYPIGEASKID